ncbi:MAG: M23 family metallopeptidase [Chloroflexota bacterium]|nr:M23 family metallopeptidase [Chloroflexota bacterium]
MNALPPRDFVSSQQEPLIPAGSPRGGSPETGVPTLARRFLTTPRRPRARRSRWRPLLLLLGIIALAAIVAGIPVVQDQAARLRWYLTDETPPSVVISAPSQTVRGVITATVDVQDQGPAELDALRLDGQTLTPTQRIVIDTAALQDGEHILWAEARDQSRQRNLARAQVTLRTENTAPTITVTLDPSTPAQGQAAVLRVTLSKAATVTASYDGNPMLLVPLSDTVRWGLLGFGADAKLVTHTLTLAATDWLGNSSRVTQTFSVTVTKFIVEDIELPPDRVGLANSPDEAQRLAQASAVVTTAPLWQGLFRVPAPGEVTAPFGEARSYNGGPVASWHGGVDLAAPAGGPVLAAAAGRVVLAQKLTVQGNTVVIDHGLGLISAYFHMDAIQVKVGDAVKQGQAVGVVGNTGLSTGPHLHWEIRLGGVPVDPWQWTKRTVP